GCITATSSGGTGPVNYHWNNGDSTATICGLGAGSYAVTITDSVGCSASTAYNVSQPTAITFNPAIITNATCQGNNGCIKVSAIGGNGNGIYYSYLWNTGDSTSFVCGLGAGTYTVTATDTLGCTGSD